MFFSLLKFLVWNRVGWFQNNCSSMLGTIFFSFLFLFFCLFYFHFFSLLSHSLFMNKTFCSVWSYGVQFCVCTISPLSLPQTLFFRSFRSAICNRGVLIGLGCPGLQMVDLSERENGLSGTETGDRANTEHVSRFYYHRFSKYFLI